MVKIPDKTALRPDANVRQQKTFVQRPLIWLDGRSPLFIGANKRLLNLRKRERLKFQSQFSKRSVGSFIFNRCSLGCRQRSALCKELSGRF